MTDVIHTDLRYPMARTNPFDPPPEYAELRRSEPFTRVRLWDGTTPWLLTRYQDMRVVLASPQFSAEPLREGYPHVFEGRMVADKADKSFLRLDAPEHDWQRRMVTREFTVRRVEGQRPFIEGIVDKLIDRMEDGERPIEFVTAFAQPLPTEVITHLLGVPYEDHEIFHRATRIQFGSNSTPDEVRASLAELMAYLDELVSRKEAQPQDDILSRLVTEQLLPGNVDRGTLLNITRLLLSAGHQTTQNMTALGVLTLLQYPGQLAAIREDPGLIRGAVEELLRYSSILHTGARRTALQDIDVNGHLIKKGEGVICAIPSANREETLFPEPDRFDIRRDAGPHVAFGYGIHQCLGQVLARAELQIVLRKLFTRLPGLRLAVPFDQLRFRHDMFVYGVYELPLTW
jgi:cytochrome P450